jgi:hypothetical protein
MGIKSKDIGSICRTLLLTISVTMLLISCGGSGGGGGSASSSPNSVAGTIASGVIVTPEADATAATLELDPFQSGALLITNPTGALAKVKTGDIIYLPANDSQGIPFGLTGKVMQNADGSITLQPAALEDVFTKLSIDFDTTLDNTQIGLISTKGGYISLSQGKPSTLQTGLDLSLCQVGLNAVVDLACKNGAIEGKIGLEHKILVQKKGDTEKTWATIYATIDISDLSAKVKLDYDAEKYPGTGGLNQAMVNLTGTWGAQVGIKVDDDDATAEIPSLSELLHADGANIWDDVNTKVLFGKYFELSGLNNDNKQGLIPLGGIYLTPAGSIAFSGQDVAAPQINAIKAGAIIIWVYIDAAGHITLSGDLKFLDLNGASVQKGFDITRSDDNNLNTRVINTQTNSSSRAPVIKGKVEVSQNVGLAVAADLMVGGVRPFTIKMEIAGVKVEGQAEGEIGLHVLPTPMELYGNGCAKLEGKFYSDFTLRAALNAKLDTKWLKSTVGLLDVTIGPEELVWGDLSWASCVNSYLLPLSAAVSGQDSTDPTKSIVKIDFVDAFNNTPLREQTGTWRLSIEGPLSSSWIDVDTSYGGLYTLALAVGTYEFTMQSLHKDLKDGTGAEVVVATSSPVMLTISSAPVVDFSAPMIYTNCQDLTLVSNASASPPATLTDYKWVVTQSGGSAMTEQGADKQTASFILATCGEVSVTHTVTDNQGNTTSLAKVIDTNAVLLPTGIKATNGNGQVTISWNTVSGATSYNLYEATVSGVTKTNYISLAGGAMTTGVTSPFTQIGLINGTTYYFVVTAVTALGESIESSQVSAVLQGVSITTVAALRNSFNPGACQSHTAGAFSALVGYHSCGAAVLEDFILTYGNCSLTKAADKVTLTGNGKSVSAILDSQYEDQVDVGYGDANYLFGSDLGFKFFAIGPDNDYVTINLHTDGSNITLLNGSNWSLSPAVSVFCNP